MIETFNGLILTEVKYGETSKIINVLTDKFGLVGIHAKGARSLKSPFRNATNKLILNEFIVKYNKDKLSNLKEINIINNFKNIKKDIEKIGYASLLLDLTNQVIKHGSSDNLFYNLSNALIKIDEGLNPNVITIIVMLKYLDNLGVAPVLDCCLECGNTNIATISSYRGGFVCKNCLKDEEIMSEKAINLLRMFYLVDIKKIDKIEVNKDIIKELENFIEDYYTRYTGLYLKSKDFLNEIKK